MFKKKRNALLEEMRKIAEDETVRVLESAGLITERLHVIGVSGAHSKYVAKPAEDHVARALAEEAIADAQEALEAAGGIRIERIVREVLAAQELERETAEAYRAADEAQATVDAAASVARAAAKRATDTAGVTNGTASSEEEDPYVARERQKWEFFEASIADSAVDRMRLEFSNQFEDRLAGLEEQSRLRLRLLQEVFPGVTLSSTDNVQFTSRFEDAARNLVKSFGADCHYSSPVVAESEAATSDAPAMTVQEGGSSDAAPGVGWATVARSTPRFVVLGELVYDRDANKAVSCINSSAAQSVAAELNANHGNHNRFYWEDAK